jgi:ribosomal peptide maturation radical SAM protein 1
VPSLAVAKRLKRRRPETQVLFGGGNCDGEMGVALHREFPFVDLVLRGEADETFPALLDALATVACGGDREILATVPGLCWRDEQGAPRVNRRPVPLVAPTSMHRPDFDTWFTLFDESVVSLYVEPELVVESARGCWWGELHHCTFCGLNGTSMAFRAKAPSVFLAEIDHLVRRHRVLDVTVVDNILEPRYLRETLPELAEWGWDLRMHYDIKANLTAEQILVLKRSGVLSVQPGIESLVDDVLVRMDKGVKADRNIRTLRDCAAAGVTVAWNWLYGFPGEREADYRRVIEQVPALVHLRPPGSVARIELNRFSPYFNDPALGFAVRTPAEPYSFVYDLAQERLHDLVYLFDTPPSGLTDEQATPLHTAGALWTRNHPESSLRQVNIDGGILLRDRRVGWPATDHLLEEPRHRATWAELEHGRSTEALSRRLTAAGIEWEPDGLRRWLEELRERGLVFVESDRWIALPTNPDFAVAPDQRPAELVLTAGPHG